MTSSLYRPVYPLASPNGEVDPAFLVRSFDPSGTNAPRPLVLRTRHGLRPFTVRCANRCAARIPLRGRIVHAVRSRVVATRGVCLCCALATQSVPQGGTPAHRAHTAQRCTPTPRMHPRSDTSTRRTTLRTP
ncbi:hypothetical protein [Brachybacterium sacelli]|uniref:hypothetical protein n=1 Tax=Brachybacterium sacelli TaxID=173364 RepID=UPI003612EB3E